MNEPNKQKSTAFRRNHILNHIQNQINKNTKFNLKRKLFSFLLFLLKTTKKHENSFADSVIFPWIKKLFQNKHKNRLKNAYLCLSAGFQHSTKTDTIRKCFTEKTTAKSALPPAAERHNQRGNM